MNKLLLFFLVSTTLMSVGCSRDKELDGDVTASNSVQIRVKNASLLPLDNIEVNTSGGLNSFGTVQESEVSDYKSFDFAYRYSFVKLTINGEPYIIQPIDYSGEDKLKRGKYTYEIQFDPESNQIFMNTVND